ncbi:MAG: hypothetical protein JSV24_07030, partial [Bacteroidales bacterium]
MKMRKAWIIPLLVAGLMIFGCTPKSKYERRLKRELASGVRNDSIFMGIYLGMPEKDFYTHCWLLNRKGLIRQGPNNLTVQYELKNELKFPGTMHFYPEFEQGKIVEMPVRFIYNGWAPWNDELSSDNLQEDLLKWFEKDYGNGFITVEHPDRGFAYVKIDGNRRITIFKQDDMYVWAVFTDMIASGEYHDSTSVKKKIFDEITKD